mgnify:CR=1 FL=1
MYLNTAKKKAIIIGGTKNTNAIVTGLPVFITKSSKPDFICSSELSSVLSSVPDDLLSISVPILCVSLASGFA